MTLHAAGVLPVEVERAQARPATNPSRVVRAVSTRWAATSCTVHPSQSDCSSHCPASRLSRWRISAARSACTIGHTSPTGASVIRYEHEQSGPAASPELIGPCSQAAQRSGPPL